MNFRHLIVLSFLALLLISLPVQLGAQTTTSGGLTGVVTDPSGAVIPNADVLLRSDSKGTLQSTKTDREGEYHFFFLAPGRYTLRVASTGFRIETQQTDVLLGPPASLNVKLDITNERSIVKVTGDAPLINAENGDFSTTANHMEVSEVPNPGNDLTYIFQTAPGVVMDTDIQGQANFSILGMPGTSVLFTLNGTNNNDNGYNYNNVGSLNLLLGQNQVQEATMVSIGYSGQFGGTAGASVNYITKSGGNDLHGNAQYYWNASILNANNWLNNATGVARPRTNANQWAGSLGGAIKKTRLFYFFDTEGLRVLLPSTFFNTIPSPQFESATIANIDARFGSASASHKFYKTIFDLYNTAIGAGSAQPGGWSLVGDPTGCTGFTGLPAGIPCASHYADSRGVPGADTLTSGRIDWNVDAKDRAFLQTQYDWGHVTFLDAINSAFDGYHRQPWWEGAFSETHIFSPNTESQFLLAGSYIGWWNGLAHPQQALAAFPATLFFNSTGTFNPLAAWNSSLGVPTLDAFFQGGVDPASSYVDFTQLTQSFVWANTALGTGVCRRTTPVSVA